jgi:hypothetical protein
MSGTTHTLTTNVSRAYRTDDIRLTDLMADLKTITNFCSICTVRFCIFCRFKTPFVENIGMCLVEKAGGLRIVY